MRNVRTLSFALVLIGLGLLGLAVVPALLQRVGPVGGFTSMGQRIYFTGADAAGQIPRRMGGGNCGTASGASCADCHGADGHGGRVTPAAGISFVAPDIRYSTLTSPHSDEGTTSPAWTEADIASAIRDGTDPDGQPVAVSMPRWSMTDTDMTDVIAYLKELSSR
jgi:cytochrome c oxidase subunit 2